MVLACVQHAFCSLGRSGVTCAVRLYQLPAESQLCVAAKSLQCRKIPFIPGHQQFTPQMRIVVPAEAHTVRTLDTQRPNLLHCQRSNAVSYHWRHGEQHGCHATIRTGHLPSEHQGFEREPIPASRSGRSVGMTSSVLPIARCGSPPVHIAESQVDDHEGKERQAPLGNGIESAPLVAVRRDHRNRISGRTIDGEFTKELDELLVEMMRQGDRPGTFPPVLRELFSMLRMSVTRVFHFCRHQVSSPGGIVVW